MANEFQGCQICVTKLAQWVTSSITAKTWPKLAQWHSRGNGYQNCNKITPHSCSWKTTTYFSEFHLGQNQVPGGQGFHFNLLTKKTTRGSIMKGVQFHGKPTDLTLLLNSLTLKIVSTHLENKLCDQQKFMILTCFIHHNENSSPAHYEGWILNTIARREKLNVCCTVNEHHH